MINAGFDSQVVIATDMAEAYMWTRIGKGLGLTGLITQIIPRLKDFSFEPETIQKLVGKNIATRLARPYQPDL
jgi:hypothetical protein